MVDCPLCSGYGTILLHDRESDSERETTCWYCLLGTPRINLEGHMKTKRPSPPADLEKELDAVVKRAMDHFGD